MTDALTPARLRVAPSPTGDPHVGTAYQALFNKAYARKTGGAFVLRVEDTDRARYVPESEAQIYETLEWLGLSPDESPVVGGPHAPYTQSQRLTTYRPFVDQLIEAGHAYYCWCSPERLAEMRQAQQDAKADVVGYDRLCHGKTAEERAQLLGFQETPVVRMLIPDDIALTFDDLIAGPTKAPRPDDQVILKADGFPTYHMAVVVDDHLMGITHVIRGQEWISSTPKHIQLYKWLGVEPPKFAHLPLIRNTDKSKISKRNNPAARLTWFRESGYLPEALINFLMLLGYPPVHEGNDVQTFEEFVDAFSWSKVSPAGPVFDLEKLNWLNGAHIRGLEPDELARRIVDYAREFQGADWDGDDADLVRRATPLIQERLGLLSEAKEKLAFLFAPDDGIVVADDAAAQLSEQTPAIVAGALEALTGLEDWRAEPIQSALKAKLVDEMGLKARIAFAPVRIAMSGQKVSPPLFESMELLGKESCLTRLGRLA